MPMKRFEDRGSEGNGDKSEEYCKFCYVSGKFVDEGITMEQKIEHNIEVAKKMGMREEQARMLAQRIIPKLRRWNNEKF
jgi:hypothetical protein